MNATYRQPVKSEAAEPRGLWSELFRDNPMLDEAGREQRRFFRSAYGLGRFGPAIVLGIVGLLYLWMLIEAMLSRDDGSAVFSYLELVLLTLILPGSIYAAISGERERATWDALVLTRLTPAQIVAGKLVWRFRLTLILAALAILPIIASRTISVHNSATNTEVFMAQMVIVLWSAFLCSFGLWVSALTKRSITSLAVIAVGLISALGLLPMLYSMFYEALTGNASALQNDPIFKLILDFNPFTALSFILENNNNAGPSNPGVYGSGVPQCFVYFVSAAVLTGLTCRRLRRLEEPGKTTR